MAYTASHLAANITAVEIKGWIGNITTTSHPGSDITFTSDARIHNPDRAYSSPGILRIKFTRNADTSANLEVSIPQGSGILVKAV